MASSASWRQLSSGHYVNSTTGLFDDFTCGGCTWVAEVMVRWCCCAVGPLLLYVPAAPGWLASRSAVFAIATASAHAAGCCQPCVLAVTLKLELVTTRGAGIQEDGSAWCWGSDYSGLGLLGGEAPGRTDAPGMQFTARYSLEPLAVTQAGLPCLHSVTQCGLRRLLTAGSCVLCCSVLPAKSCSERS